MGKRRGDGGAFGRRSRKWVRGGLMVVVCGIHADIQGRPSTDLMGHKTTEEGRGGGPLPLRSVLATICALASTVWHVYTVRVSLLRVLLQLSNAVVSGGW